MAVPKLERLMNLLAAMLHTRVPLSAAVLVERVDGYSDDPVACRRQFSRDKEDLREMGVPIRLEPVPGSDPQVDGYRVDPDEYYLPDPQLDVEELAALHLATRLVSVEPTAAGSGLAKLGGMTGAVDTETAPWVSMPSDPNLGTLFDAIHRNRAVQFEYHRTQRRLVPGALGFQNGHWYVSGGDLDAGEDRVYRLDRISGAVTDAGDAPENPGTARSLQRLQPWRIGDRAPIGVRIRVDHSAVPAMTVQLGEDRIGPADANGTIEATVDVFDVEGFRSWILEFGAEVEVVDPPALRDEIVAWVEAILEVRS